MNSKLKQLVALNLSEPSQRVQPTFSSRPKLLDQTSPVTCYNKSIDILPHDGTAKFGDLVESDFRYTFLVGNIVENRGVLGDC